MRGVWWCALIVGAACCGAPPAPSNEGLGGEHTPLMRQPPHRAPADSLALQLRGGGKGGCKAKHLSGKGKGRHFLVTKDKHAFPNLRLGAAHAVASGDNSSLVPTGVRRQGKHRAADPEDSDSYSSWEIEEQYAKFRQRIATDRVPPPEAGLIPLTSKGAREFGAVELASSYMGRPIQIMRRARDPRDGDVWGWGANYDGQLGIADGCRMVRPPRTPTHPHSDTDTHTHTHEHTTRALTHTNTHTQIYIAVAVRLFRGIWQPLLPCVCVCVCVCLHIYVCIHTCIRICVYTYVYTYVQVVHMHIIYIDTCVCVCVCVCVLCRTGGSRRASSLCPTVQWRR